MSGSVPSNGHGRRFSSFARDVDTAIERVVSHFEESDVALRLDVLRSLAAHAQLLYETERVKERLRQHPATKELVERVTTRSRVYARLLERMAVEEFSCDYDRQRNVEMRATVRWSLADTELDGDADGERRAKKPKGVATAARTGKRRREVRSGADALWTRYAFSRTLNADGETIVAFAVTVSVGAEGEAMPLVRYELASDAPYPRSYYEEDHAMDSDEDEDAEHDGEPAAENEPSSESDEDDDDDALTKHRASNEEGEKDDQEEEEEEQEQGEKDAFGEQIRGFDFGDGALDAVLAWLRAEPEELDPADVIGFFLALPIYEDDWMIDERICQILFSAGAGDSEMDGDVEVVSDFDEDNEQEAEEDDDEEDDEDGSHDEAGAAADLD